MGSREPLPCSKGCLGLRRGQGKGPCITGLTPWRRGPPGPFRPKAGLQACSPPVCSPGRSPGSLLPSVCVRLQNGHIWGAFSLGSRLDPRCVFLGQELVVETPWAPSNLVGLPEKPHHVPPAQQTPQCQPDCISVCDSAHHRLPKSPGSRRTTGTFLQTLAWLLTSPDSGRACPEAWRVGVPGPGAVPGQSWPARDRRQLQAPSRLGCPHRRGASPPVLPGRAISRGAFSLTCRRSVGARSAVSQAPVCSQGSLWRGPSGSQFLEAPKKQTAPLEREQAHCGGQEAGLASQHLGSGSSSVV